MVQTGASGRPALDETMVVDDALEGRIAEVERRIEGAVARSGRERAAVTLVAVSKTVDRETMLRAYDLGLRHFGENRVQDATVRFADPLPDDLTLHLIGQLQTNKARAAVRIARVVESVDRPSLVDALQQALMRQAESDVTADPRPLDVLVQVNVAGEEQKAGCDLEDAPALVERVLSASRLRLRGLMLIAPLVDHADLVRPHFARLRELRDSLASRYPEADLSTLSMGMTNDFEVAIEEGATQVRIGRAVFG